MAHLRVVEEVGERVALDDQRRRLLPHVALQPRAARAVDRARLKRVEPVGVPAGEVAPLPAGAGGARARERAARPLELGVLLVVPRVDVLLKVELRRLAVRQVAECHRGVAHQRELSGRRAAEPAERGSEGGDAIASKNRGATSASEGNQTPNEKRCTVDGRKDDNASHGEGSPPLQWVMTGEGPMSRGANRVDGRMIQNQEAGWRVRHVSLADIPTFNATDGERLRGRDNRGGGTRDTRRAHDCATATPPRLSPMR